MIQKKQVHQTIQNHAYWVYYNTYSVQFYFQSLQSTNTTHCELRKRMTSFSENININKIYNEAKDMGQQKNNK